MTTDLAPIEITNGISPVEFAQSMVDAVAKAKTFTEIVEQQNLYTKMGQGKHLHVEAWQTIAMGYGLTPGIKSSEILYDDDGTEIGAKSMSVVYDRTGTVRGGAEAYCMRSERTWANKPIYQLLSMAGTRAVSKALRLLLAWVVVLAGYSPTPADEMERSEPTGSARPASKPVQRRKAAQQSDEGRVTITSAEASGLMTYADELSVPRPDVMAELLEEFDLDSPLKLDAAQLEAMREFIETNAPETDQTDDLPF